MSASEEFKVGPDYLNEVLREAEIEGMTLTKTQAGQLYLDTELSGPEQLNRMLTGLSVLYRKLVTARLSWA